MTRPPPASQAPRPARPSGAETFRTAVCPHDCPDACSVRVGVTAGRVVSLAGDAEHPITAGRLCGKVSRYTERIYHPQRILTPLRRMGAKGEGRFAPMGWDEALDEIATRWGEIIAQHGAEAILPYSFGGTCGRIGFYIGHRFFHALGASRLERTICTGSSVQGLRMTMGYGVATPLEEIPQSRLILVWGQNAVASHVHLMPLLKQARAAGAQVVVIDVYRTATARQADWFVQVRPGTDAALALGLMHVVLAEGLHDAAFIARYTHGFEALREACAPYTPEHVAALTGVPAGEVLRLGRAYGSTPASYIRLGLGLSRHAHGGLTTRTIACLPALTGAWDVPGGGLRAYGWGGSWLNNTVLEAPHPGDPPARAVNMVRLGEALTALRDPPVQSLYVYNANPAAIAPEQALVREGLRRPDLFTVVHEQMPTDTVDYADIVLPATTFLEHDDLVTSYGHDYVQLSRAAIAPRGEARSNHHTFRALAGRLGLRDPVLECDFEALAAQLLDSRHPEAQGLERDALWAGRPVRFAVPEAPWRTGLGTPSGRFEFVSERMAKLGLPATPAWLPSPEAHATNGAYAAYPLQLVTPPSQHFLNSSFGETPTGRRLERAPRLKLHPADAAARGLADGAPCRAFNGRGECFLVVEVTEDVRPGVCVAESVWWPKFHAGGKGINQLTSADLTDLGGCARFHDVRIQVETVLPTDLPPQPTTAAGERAAENPTVGD